MTRAEALALIQANVKNQNTLKHMLATEAIMSAMAERLGEDVGEWGLTGLLHDVDYEITEEAPQTHSKLGAEMVKKLGASPATVQAILCHNEAHGLPRQTPLDKALYCADPLTGLIVAGALVRPDKKLASLTVDSLLKRFGEKRFAAGASREQIGLCSELGLTLEEFMGLGLQAMQGIASDLGL